MKLIRFGQPGQERPGLQLPDGERVDASAFGQDYDERFFGGGSLRALREWASREAAGAPRVPAATRLGPPICRPSKIVCIGVNFRDHAAESGAAPPSEPVIFMIFSVPTLVSYVSQFMTLLPGDVISTGTPAGVALGMKPAPVYLKAGDVVALGIEALGESRQRVVDRA